MYDIRQTVAENLSELRKKNGLTQTELAAKLNYSDKSVSKWERGEALPDIEVLCELASIYGVTLDMLVHELSDEKKVENTQERKRECSNKLTITLLAIIAVWFLAITFYVYSFIYFQRTDWIVFIYAITLSSVVALVFNCIWGRKIYTFYIVSVILWSILTSIYCQYLSYNIWAIFLIGAPAQVAIILWANLRKHKRRGKD